MEKLELIIEPTNNDYDPTDMRWIGQSNQLLKDLDRNVGTIDKISTPQEGMKGSFETIILALISAGAINALINLIQSWILRDRNRCVKIKLPVGDSERIWEFCGYSLNNEAMENFSKVVMEEWLKKNGKN